MGQNTNENTNWRELFSLYRDLAGPFKEFEVRSSNKRTIEQGASNARRTINYGYKRTIREALVFMLKWAIPFLIVFYIMLNVFKVNGEKLFDYYSEALTHLVEEPIEAAFFNGDANVTQTQALVAAFFVLVPVPCLIFLFPLRIICNVISRAYKISKAKKTLKTCEEQLPQAEAALQEAQEKIAPYVKYVPPNYRNSSALAFFSNSFFNFKVKNLQEAVNLYDEYLHQQRMEQGQREMAQAQKDAMDNISRQLDHMEDLINSQEYVIYETHYH